MLCHPMSPGHPAFFFFFRVSDLPSNGDTRDPCVLSKTTWKTQESSFAPSSQDVLEALALENNQVGMIQKCLIKHPNTSQNFGAKDN